MLMSQMRCYACAFKNQCFAGLSLEELVLCQLHQRFAAIHDIRFSPLPSDAILSRLTTLTCLKLHVSVSQACSQSTLQLG